MFFERLVHRHLASTLEASDLLFHEQTGFRMRLTSRNSFLDFLSGVEHNRSTGSYTVAAVLNAQSVFDSVGAHTAPESLLAVGLKKRLICFFDSYVVGKSFPVKLGNPVSSPRSQGIGLPQGNVLSTRVINVVVARGTAKLLHGSQKLSTSSYAYVICAWSPGGFVPPIHKSFKQSLLCSLAQ